MAAAQDPEGRGPHKGLAPRPALPSRAAPARRRWRVVFSRHPSCLFDRSTLKGRSRPKSGNCRHWVATKGLGVAKKGVGRAQRAPNEKIRKANLTIGERLSP